MVNKRTAIFEERLIVPIPADWKMGFHVGLVTSLEAFRTAFLITKELIYE
jgi:hypothetical protein